CRGGAQQVQTELTSMLADEGLIAAVPDALTLLEGFDLEWQSFTDRLRARIREDGQSIRTLEALADICASLHRFEAGRIADISAAGELDRLVWLCQNAGATRGASVAAYFVLESALPAVPGIPGSAEGRQIVLQILQQPTHLGAIDVHVDLM